MTNSENFDFSNQVAIITGAARGLGRSHALAMAKRGAKIVVNDFGGSVDGANIPSNAALEVVDEIKALGGFAIADFGSVTNENDVENMVAKTMNEWGRVDILINNAGILRDKSFGKMEYNDVFDVMNVHFMGTYNAIKKVWDIMKAQNYGRIIVTTSSSGLYGNFGQSNYGAAKMALVGLMNSLKIEGAKNNIHTNAIAPVALTRMTENLLPPEFGELLLPEKVTPAVEFLCSKQAPNGVILSAGAGSVAHANIVETIGVAFSEGDLTAENIAQNYSKICDLSTAEPLSQGALQTQKFLMQISKLKGATN